MDNEKPDRAAAADRDGGREATKGDATGGDVKKGDVAKGPTPTASGLKDARPSGAVAPAKGAGPLLPVAEPFHAISSAPPKEPTGIFSRLVTDDGDIAGLVAYSIYKQNKLDWLAAFEAARGRAPNDDELASYILGEGTPRRIATYRHLAEATLAGHGPGASKTGQGGRVSLFAAVRFAATRLLCSPPTRWSRCCS